MEDLILLKWQCTTKLFCRFSSILIKISTVLFFHIWSRWSENAFGKENRRPKTILKKKNNIVAITFPNFKIYYKTIVIKAVRVLAKGYTYRPMGQNWEPRWGHQWLRTKVYVPTACPEAGPQFSLWQGFWTAYLCVHHAANLM